MATMVIYLYCFCCLRLENTAPAPPPLLYNIFFNSTLPLLGLLLRSSSFRSPFLFYFFFFSCRLQSNFFSRLFFAFCTRRECELKIGNDREAIDFFLLATFHTSLEPPAPASVTLVSSQSLAKLTNELLRLCLVFFHHQLVTRKIQKFDFSSS